MEPVYAPGVEDLYRQFWNETEASWRDLKFDVQKFYGIYELNHCADLNATISDIKDEIAAGLTQLDEKSLVPRGMAYYLTLSSERSNLTSLATYIFQMQKKVQEPCERAKLTVDKMKQYEAI